MLSVAEKHANNVDINKLSKFTKIMPPIFFLFSIYALTAAILAGVGIGSIGGWVLFIIVILCTIALSIITAVIIYKWNQVQQEIEMVLQENTKYENEIDELKHTKSMLWNNVKNLQQDTEILNREVDKLKGALSTFDELKTSLKEMVEDSGGLQQLINDINNEMNNFSKATLFAAYHDAKKKQEMTEIEYQTFLSNIDKNERIILKSFGSFDTISGGDGKLDKEEFQTLIDKLLTEQTDDIQIE
eukprot:369173_1